MISVDTNIIVRLLTGDDQAQFKRAKAIFAENNAVITTSVVLECEWVLRYAYGFDPSEIDNAFQALFGLPNVQPQEPFVIFDAIEWHKQGLDFSDAVHLAKSSESEAFITFDKQLIKASSGIDRIPVKEP
jgi:predicted nucleic-acid-binding protein